MGLLVFCQFSQNLKECLVEALYLAITLCMIRSHLAFLNAKSGAELICKLGGEVPTSIAQELSWCTKHGNEPVIKDFGHCLGSFILGYKGHCITCEVVSYDKDILYPGWLVEFHISLNTCKIHVHKLQQHICPDGAQWSLWDCTFKGATPLTAPHHGFAILCHIWPPELFLGRAECPQLTLMSCISVDAIQSNPMLVCWHNKGMDTLHFSLGGGIQI